MENILIVTEYGIDAKREELRATRGRVRFGNPGGVLALVSSLAGTLRSASATVEAWAKRPRAATVDLPLRGSAETFR
jgi:hypothetical protein